MRPARVDPAITTSERPHTHALDGAVTGIGHEGYQFNQIDPVSPWKVIPKQKHWPLYRPEMKRVKQWKVLNFKLTGEWRLRFLTCLIGKVLCSVTPQHSSQRHISRRCLNSGLANLVEDAWPNFEEILSRHHKNFEEQNKVSEHDEIINYCIIIIIKAC